MSLPAREDISRLEALIRNAGACLMRHWPGAAHQLSNIQQKEDGSSVTEADYASNAILMDGLQQLFPDDGILSEEAAPDPDLQRKKRVWIVDPLDGTRSFIEGRDDFSILIGLTVEGIPHFGIMFFPARGMLAVAGEGTGALLNGERQRVSAAEKLRPRSVYYRNFSPPPGAYLFEEYLDSGLALLNVGRGEFDGLIIRMTKHKEWDLAAPAAFLREGGARVTDEHGNPVRFNRGGIDFKYFVASNGRVHDELLGLIPKEDR